MSRLPWLLMPLSMLAYAAGSHAADIFVTNESGAFSVNQATGALTAVGSFSAPRGLAVDTQGTLYVAASGKIHRIPGGGSSSAFVSLSNVVGLFFDRISGNLYSANGSSNSVSRISSSGTITTIATGLSGPRNLVMDNRGYLYVSNTNAGNIIEINPSDNSKRVFATGLTTPRGIAYGSDGSFYVSNYGNGTVARIDSAGTVFPNFVTGLSNPDGIAFDDNGNLFIVNSGAGNLRKRDSAGNLTTLASLGGGQSIAISVPEPSIRVFAMISTGVLFILGWRRSKPFSRSTGAIRSS